MFGIQLDPAVISALQILVGAIVLLAALVYLFRLSVTVTHTLIELREARPILVKIATEFAPDHETTLKDTTNRLERQGGVSQDMNRRQQESIDKILAVLAHQEIINNQVDAVLAKLLTQLYAEQARLVAEGDSKAAIVLQTLINNLRQELDALRQQQPFGNINITTLGTSASVGQAATGADIAQHGLDATKRGLAETQAGVNQVKKEQA